MFQDALMESGGQINTRSRYFSLLGLAINGLILLALILWPMLHPLELPKQAMNTLLIAPAPPAAAASVRHTVAAAAAKPATLSLQMLAPSTISRSIATIADATPDISGVTDMSGMNGAISGSTVGDLFKSSGTAARPVVQVAVPKKTLISSGVMAGNKISGASPAYPAIARAARVQGTVVIAATIAKSGAIENLRVSSGPPMLTTNALDAVKTWRYRPYLLNGAPVEVETTINVVFSLGN